MDFLPRVKKEVIKQISVKKQEIRIDFNEEDVKKALLAYYRDVKVGPEGYFIPEDCEVRLLDDCELTFYVDE